MFSNYAMNIKTAFGNIGINIYLTSEHEDSTHSKCIGIKGWNPVGIDRHVSRLIAGRTDVGLESEGHPIGGRRGNVVAMYS